MERLHLDAYAIKVVQGQLTLSPLQSSISLGTGGGGFALSANGGHIYVTNQTTYPSNGVLYAFPRNATTGVLDTAVSTSTSTNTPGAVAVNPVSGMIYIAEDPTAACINGWAMGQQKISGYSFNAAQGTFAVLPNGPYSTPTPPHALTVDPGGRFLYVTGTCNNISAGTMSNDTRAFSLQANGAVTTPARTIAPAGGQPVTIVTDPTGFLLYTANYNDGNGNGGVGIYTTSAPVPVITSLTTGNSKASLKAALTNALGLPSIASTGFLYGQNPDSTQGAVSVTVPFSNNAFATQIPLTELQPGVPYYVRPFATTSSGARYVGNAVSFVNQRVLNDMAPPVFAQGQLQFTDSINSIPQGEQVSTVGFMVVTAANPRTPVATIPGTLNGMTFTGAATLPLSNLNAGPYSVRAFLTTTSGATYAGNALPYDNTSIITTGTPGALGFNAIPLSATLRPGLTVSQAGFAYATTNLPTTANATLVSTPQANALSAALPLSGLQAGATYYVRAYVVMSDGTTVYGSATSFVNTVALTASVSLGMNNATLSGSQRANLGASSVGFVYGQSANPTVYDTVVTATSNGNNFSAQLSLSSLTAGATYYVRAYARDNSGNVLYSTQSSFTNAPLLSLSVSNITNIDGNYQITIDPRVTGIKIRDISFMEGGVRKSAVFPANGQGSFGGLLLPNTAYTATATVILDDSSSTHISSNSVTFTTPAATLGQRMRGGILVSLDAPGQHGLIAYTSNTNSKVATLSQVQANIQSPWRLPSTAELQVLAGANKQGLITLAITPVSGYWSAEDCYQVGGCTNIDYQWVFMMNGGNVINVAQSRQFWARAVRTF